MERFDDLLRPPYRPWGDNDCAGSQCRSQVHGGIPDRRAPPFPPLLLNGCAAPPLLGTVPCPPPPPLPPLVPDGGVSVWMPCSARCCRDARTRCGLCICGCPITAAGAWPLHAPCHMMARCVDGTCACARSRQAKPSKPAIPQAVAAPAPGPLPARTHSNDGPDPMCILPAQAAPAHRRLRKPKRRPAFLTQAQSRVSGVLPLIH